jgi:hypothetical protein
MYKLIQVIFWGKLVMNYDIVYYLSQEEIKKYLENLNSKVLQKPHYSKEGIKNLLKKIKDAKAIKFLFNVIDYKDEDLVKYFDPEFFCQIFGSLYNGQILVVDVMTVEPDTNWEAKNKKAIKYRVFTKDRQDYYSLYLWINNIGVNFKEEQRTFRKDYWHYKDVIFSQLGRNNNEVKMDCPELGFYKPIPIKSICASCVYYNRSQVLNCAVNPMISQEYILTCKDYSRDKKKPIHNFGVKEMQKL